MLRLLHLLEPSVAPRCCMLALGMSRARCRQVVEEAPRPVSPEAVSPCPKKPRLKLDIPCPVRGIEYMVLIFVLKVLGILH